MLIDCSLLLQTLTALHYATAIGVTGTCPAYVQIKVVVPGSTIDFSQATGITRLDLTGVNHLTVQNYSSTNATYSALNVLNSQQILLLQPRIISPGTAGITISGSDTVEVSGPWVSGSKGDGVDIAGSTNINIHDGACDGNNPTAIHPDCVQAWSVTGYPIQHLIIQNMTAIGPTQGFDLWDASNYGANDVQILNNHAAIGTWNCVGAYNVTQLVVSGNDCHTLPTGSGPPRLNLQNDPGAVVTNNVLGLPLATPIQ